MTTSFRQPSSEQPLDAAPGRRGSRRALAIVVVLLVVAAGIGVGVLLARSKGNDAQVVMLGDSITELADAPLHQRFDGKYAVTVSGVAGARADQRVADAAGLASTTPGQVVINLGTNDVLQGTPTDETVASLTQIADGFTDARCIHFVTINESMVDLSRPQLHEQAAAVNQRLRALASQRGWDIIDWAGIVAAADRAGNPDGPLTTDTVHPTPAGQAKLLDAYGDALARC